MSDESLLGDGKVHGIDNIGNDPALIALSTMELNINDDFLSKMKGAYSS